jgi:ATP-dependent Clp protease ATP-binding subunit ClpA
MAEPMIDPEWLLRMAAREAGCVVSTGGLWARWHFPAAQDEGPMFERFTDRSRKVMQLANQEAQRFGQGALTAPYVLLGLLKEGSGVAAHVLKNLDIDLAKLRGAAETLASAGRSEGDCPGRLPLADDVRQAVLDATAEAGGLGHNYVGTEHLLLGLLRQPDGPATRVLAGCGVTAGAVRAEVMALLGRPAEAEGGALPDGDLGPLPAVHPRHAPVTAAAVELEDFLGDWRDRHRLTSAEYLALVARAAEAFALRLVRKERSQGEGAAPARPGGGSVQVATDIAGRP